ncbi:unnamed protein product [Jaminaea pallidilutea]
MSAPTVSSPSASSALSPTASSSGSPSASVDSPGAVQTGSDNNAEASAPKKRRSRVSPDDPARAARLAARAVRNRASAQNSRNRKKAEHDALEVEVVDLRERNGQLEAKVCEMDKSITALMNLVQILMKNQSTQPQALSSQSAAIEAASKPANQGVDPANLNLASFSSPSSSSSSMPATSSHSPSPLSNFIAAPTQPASLSDISDSEQNKLEREYRDGSKTKSDAACHYGRSDEEQSQVKDEPATWARAGSEIAQKQGVGGASNGVAGLFPFGSSGSPANLDDVNHSLAGDLLESLFGFSDKKAETEDSVQTSMSGASEKKQPMIKSEDDEHRTQAANTASPASDDKFGDHVIQDQNGNAASHWDLQSYGLDTAMDVNLDLDVDLSSTPDDMVIDGLYGDSTSTFDESAILAHLSSMAQ